MSKAIVLVIVAIIAQSIAFSLGRLLKGIPGKFLDVGVITVGLLFAAPSLLLAKNDLIPVALWSISWIGAYFVGNIPSPKKKLIFVAWVVATCTAMVWVMPE
jgi:hypothetical protein